VSQENEIFKCRVCGMKKRNKDCSTKDVGICNECSGEAKEE